MCMYNKLAKSMYKYVINLYNFMVSEIKAIFIYLFT